MKQWLIVVASLISLAGFAQKQRRSYKYEQRQKELEAFQINTHYFMWDTTAIDGSLSADYGNVEIIDERFNKNCVGFGVHKREYQFLEIKDGFQNMMQVTLRQMTAPRRNADASDLLIVFKSFWKNQFDYKSAQLQLYGRKGDKSPLGLYIKAEIYIADSGSYIPLVRYETPASVEGQQPLEEQYKIESALSQLIALINRQDIKARKAKGRKLSKEQIITAARQLNTLTNNDSLRADGVYQTFNQFKLNKPGITGKLKKQEEKNAFTEHRSVFIQVDTQLVRLTDVWGYCENNIVYVKIGNAFFPLTNKAGQYYCWLPYTVELYRNTFLEQYLVLGRSYTNPYTPGYIETETREWAYCLNMSDGKLY